MSLRAITDALGGDLYDGGRRANVPAPGHSRADRSVSLLLSCGRVVVHSFGGADWRGVLDDLRARGLIDAAGAPSGGCRAGRPEALQQTNQLQRLSLVAELWAAAQPLGETLSAAHAGFRRINRQLPGANVLRNHPAAPLSVYQPSPRTRPALLAAMRDVEGRLTALEVTYLAPNGRRALDLRLSRKTVGVVTPGSAVRLDPADTVMLVGEGVFTTLSATERFGLPGWALLSAGNLRRWRAPEGVRHVLIAADRGRVGQASANALAGRLRADGLSARVRTPPPPDSDWNDVARRLARPAGAGADRAERRRKVG
jgi:putative DNA primase/helicase